MHHGIECVRTTEGEAGSHVAEQRITLAAFRGRWHGGPDQRRQPLGFAERKSDFSVFDSIRQDQPGSSASMPLDDRLPSNPDKAPLSGRVIFFA